MMLEPHIDSATAEYHYEGHHEAYRRKMNEALAQWRKEEPDNEFAKESILKIMQNINKVPEKYFNDIRNQGGGYVNHCFYFGILSPNMDSEDREIPEGPLRDDIKSYFGGFDEFKAEFEKKADQVFGSGYVWLVRSPQGGLYILTTANQDTPLSEGYYPILVLDLWEHSYYLKHQFRRIKHLKDWWYLVDWEKVEKLDEWWENIALKEVEKRIEEEKKLLQSATVEELEANARRMKKEL